MEMRPLGVAVVCCAAILPGYAMGQEAAEAPRPKIGYVLVVGNDVTRGDIILKQLPPGLAPGQTLRDTDLRTAERNLIRLGLFENNNMTGVRPTVEILNRQGDEGYKNLLVRVQETSTGRLRRMTGINRRGEAVASLVFEERNFDPFRFPTCWDDLVSGRAFRGAGITLRLELVQIPLGSAGMPGFFQIGSFLTPVPPAEKSRTAVKSALSN